MNMKFSNSINNALQNLQCQNCLLYSLGVTTSFTLCTAFPDASPACWAASDEACFVCSHFSPAMLPAWLALSPATPAASFALSWVAPATFDAPCFPALGHDDPSYSQDPAPALYTFGVSPTHDEHHPEVHPELIEVNPNCAHGSDSSGFFLLNIPATDSAWRRTVLFQLIIPKLLQPTSIFQTAFKVGWLAHRMPEILKLFILCILDAMQLDRQPESGSTVSCLYINIECFDRSCRLWAACRTQEILHNHEYRALHIIQTNYLQYGCAILLGPGLAHVRAILFDEMTYCSLPLGL